MPRKHGQQILKRQLKRTKQKRHASARLANKLGVPQGIRTRMKLVPGKGIAKFGKDHVPNTAGIKIRLRPRETIEQALKRLKRYGTSERSKKRRRY